MAIYDYLPAFNYIEPNNLKGLQPGFVVAQMPVASTAYGLTLKAAGVAATSASEMKFMENGTICDISVNGIVAPSANSKNLFICFNEPLNTIFNADKFYAVNLEEECPRLVQLIPGDEWMSTKALTLTEGSALAGRIALVNSGTGLYASDDFFACGTMADGTTGYHYVFLG